MKTRRLRFKINAAITLTCLSVTILFGVYLYPYEKGRRETRIEEIKILISAVFEQKKEEIANEIFARQRSALDNSLNTIEDVKGISGVIVYGIDGGLITSTNQTLISSISKQDQSTLNHGPVFIRRNLKGHPYAEYTSVIEVIGERVGFIRIYYGLADMEQEALVTFGVFFFLLISSLVIMAFLLNILLNRFVIKPTSLLRDAITRLKGGKLGEKVDLISKDEIGQVGEAFNDMSMMLEQQHNALLESVQTQQKYALELENANKNLASLNTELEDRVKGRTAELMKINEQLQREIHERILADMARKELEERLLRSQKMEALGLLAGGVAHDLNNVLSGIVSYPDLLLMELPENSSMRKPIQTIRDSGMKAAAIVQDLLTLARRGVIQTQVLDLNEEIISDYLNSPEYHRLLFQHPAVTVETRLEVSLLKIKGSPIHLKKTLMNLIINAMEAQPDGGHIVISTQNIYVDMPLTGYDQVSAGDYVVLKVQDNGTGIEKDDLKRIFEPFYSKKVLGRSGTGLGMAVVWGTAQDHQGYINVNSTPGKGTSFELYFPVTREEIAPENDIVPVKDYLGGGEVILVVDDMENQRDIASNILSRLNYKVISTASGEEAVEFLKNGSADLVLLDMIMDPGMDGLDTYRKIIEIHPGQKAIIASGYAESERVKEAQVLGVSRYIRKPYTIENLGVTIKSELLR